MAGRFVVPALQRLGFEVRGQYHRQPGKAARRRLAADELSRKPWILVHWLPGVTRSFISQRNWEKYLR